MGFPLRSKRGGRVALPSTCGEGSNPDKIEDKKSASLRQPEKSVTLLGGVVWRNAGEHSAPGPH